MTGEPSEGENPSVAVRTLLCHRDIDLAVRCLRTLAQCCADPIEIVVHEDGTLTGEDEARLGEALPGMRVLRRGIANEVMEEKLAAHPHARAFRAGSVWGLKLLDVVLAEQGDCFYLDGDVRFFRPFRGLFCRGAAAGRSIFLRDTVWTAYSIRPWHLMDNRRLRVTEAINTGLTVVDRALFDLDFVDWFLAQADWRVIPAWTEPTCWAALAERANGHTVDTRQLPNLYPSAKIADDTVGAHFLSAYRGRFRDELEAPVRNLPPVPIGLWPLRRLGPIALGCNQLKRKLGNEWERRKKAILQAVP